jgi:hypothetical protein
MQKTKGAGTQPASAGRNDRHRMVVSDLASLIDQVRKSLRLIESEIASGTTPEEAIADDIVVLDDVTPGYRWAYGVLRECDAGLSVALHLLRESMAPGERMYEFYEGGLPPAHLPVSA